jgi:hypothetical protein
MPNGVSASCMVDAVVWIAPTLPPAEARRS